MIVRIAGEGQHRLSEPQAAHLNSVDERLSAAVDANDEVEFRALFAQMLLAVEQGEPVPVEDLAPSDVVLPARDTTLHEARDLAGPDGLVPG